MCISIKHSFLFIFDNNCNNNNKNPYKKVYNNSANIIFNNMLAYVLYMYVNVLTKSENNYPIDKLNVCEGVCMMVFGLNCI